MDKNGSNLGYIIMHVLLRELSVCLTRGICRGDEGLSIDETALASVNSDARIWAEHIL